MQDKQETITLRVNGQKTKVGVQPINVVVLNDKCDEKPVSSDGKGTDECTS